VQITSENQTQPTASMNARAVRCVPWVGGTKIHILAWEVSDL